MVFNPIKFQDKLARYILFIFLVFFDHCAFIHRTWQEARVQFFIQNWQIITQDPWVLETVQRYKIELQNALGSPESLLLPVMSRTCLTVYW